MGVTIRSKLRTLLVMKLISFLSATALLGLAVLPVIQINAVAAVLFTLTASSLFLAGVVRDYAPRRAYWEPRRAGLVQFPAMREVGSDRLAA
jgi:hypothetical protein